MSDEPVRRLDEGALRVLVPRVLAGLVRRGEDFDAVNIERISIGTHRP